MPACRMKVSLPIFPKISSYGNWQYLWSNQKKRFRSIIYKQIPSFFYLPLGKKIMKIGGVDHEILLFQKCSLIIKKETN